MDVGCEKSRLPSSVESTSTSRYLNPGIQSASDTEGSQAALASGTGTSGSTVFALRFPNSMQFQTDLALAQITPSPADPVISRSISSFAGHVSRGGAYRSGRGGAQKACAWSRRRFVLCGSPQRLRGGPRKTPALAADDYWCQIAVFLMSTSVRVDRER